MLLDNCPYTVLVTGGAGYIGSHTVLALLEAGHEVVVLDNLCNASRESLRRVERLTERTLTFIEGDIRDRGLLDQLFREHAVGAVVHFAGLKAVGESVQQPLAYYEQQRRRHPGALPGHAGGRSHAAGLQLLGHGVW